MSKKQQVSTSDPDRENHAESVPEASDSTVDSAPEHAEQSREIGGRKGPEPTRYGDWEKNGRCIDF